MYNVGKVIKLERERKGISQEELCFGICAISTLSRVENGEQTPSMTTACALLERLGLQADYYITLASEKDYKIFTLVKNIKRMVAAGEYEKAYNMACDNEETFKSNCLGEQFFLALNATRMCFVNKQYETAITMAEEVLGYTCPEYLRDKRLGCLLTDVEVNAINIMAISYWKSGEKIIATNILLNLVENIIEQYGFVGDRQNMIPMLTSNLSKWLGMQYRFEEALKYVELGIRLCQECNKFRVLPYLLCNKASIYCNMPENEDRAMQLFAEAYVLFNSMQLKKDADNLRLFVLSEYGRDLSNPM